jgi:DNA-binding transcriptional MocR family regulator
MATYAMQFKSKTMQSWTPDLTELPGPKYLAIASALSRDIARGVLRPGDRLPPQRVLAEQLSIDLTTVTKAYNEVRHAGLIEGGGRRGSFVSGSAVSTPTLESTPVDTGMNLPPEPEGSSLARRMREGVAELLAQPHGLGTLQYQASGGTPADRAAAATALRKRGIAAPDDTVLITSGGQNALHAIVSAILLRGDSVCTGAYAYPGFLSIARRYGLNIIPIATDREGLLPDSLERACLAGAKAVYVVPENDNPTTATMGIERRHAIATVAERHGLVVIEDDAYGPLADVPLPSLATLAPERTWHIASVSKIVSPGLRVAWLRAPSTRHAWRVASDLHETAVMAPPLNAALVSLWLRNGAFAELVDEVRAESVARQAIAAQILAELPYVSQPTSYHLWLPLPAGASSAEIVNALRPAGLSVVPAEAFAVDPSQVEPALRISIGGGLSRDRLQRTLGLLDALIAHAPERRSAVI